MTKTLIGIVPRFNVEISCGNQTWTVDSEVVCANSAVLADCIARTPKDRLTCHITLPYSDPAIIEKMICFMCTGNYEDSWNSDSKKGRRNHDIVYSQIDDFLIWDDEWSQEKDTVLSEESLIINPRMYFIAQFFRIWPLAVLATQKYNRAAEKFWKTDNFARSFAIIYLQWDTQLSEKMRDRDRNLRFIVSSHIRKRYPEMMVSKVGKEPMRKIEKRFPYLNDDNIPHAGDKDLMSETLLEEEYFMCASVSDCGSTTKIAVDYETMSTAHEKGAFVQVEGDVLEGKVVQADLLDGDTLDISFAQRKSSSPVCLSVDDIDALLEKSVREREMAMFKVYMYNKVLD